MAFEARFKSECADCGEPIQMGELAHFVGTAVVHHICEQEVKKGQATCPDCFMEFAVNGECSC